MNNKVELLGYYGGDKEHAMSAWTSTTRDYEKKKERMPQLLKMLAENGHETPFEKSGLHFLVDTEIASHIHILKHRIGVSVNGESARYKEIREDKFFIPKDWPLEWKELLIRYNKEGNEAYHKCIEELTPVLGRKRAKESARFFKTYSSQISADIMFNFRSFVHFQRLRNSEHAQIEIREIADEMLYLVKNIKGNPFNHTLEAFGL